MAALQHSASLLAFPAQNLRLALTPAFKRHRLPDELMESLIRQCAAHAGPVRAALTAALSARMENAPINFKTAQRIFLIGPSGSGKTSVAAKLAAMAAAHGRSDLIISDAAGFNPQSAKAQAAFSCVGAREGVETIAVVSALCDAEDMLAVIHSFNLGRLIVTGLDMAGRLGALAAAVTSGATLAGVTRSAKWDAPIEILKAGELAGLLLD